MAWAFMGKKVKSEYNLKLPILKRRKNFASVSSLN